MVPGILGAVGLLTAMFRLEHFGLAFPALFTAIAALLAAVLASFRATLWFWLAITCGAFLAATGRLVIAGDASVSWPASMAGALAGFVITWLAAQAGRAWRNKRTDNFGDSR